MRFSQPLKRLRSIYTATASYYLPRFTFPTTASILAHTARTTLKINTLFAKNSHKNKSVRKSLPFKIWATNVFYSKQENIRATTPSSTFWNASIRSIPLSTKTVPFAVSTSILRQPRLKITKNFTKPVSVLTNFSKKPITKTSTNCCIQRAQRATTLTTQKRWTARWKAELMMWA